MKSVRIFAPGSVANVSCGFDVLGFCLDPIGDEMVIRRTDEEVIRISKIEGAALPMEIDKNVAGVAATAFLKDIPEKCGFDIEIYKRIKPGSGIGSSAASACGAVFGMNALLKNPLQPKELIAYAMAGEAVASGAAHADNLAPVLLGGFTLIRSNDPLDVVQLPCPSKLHATILHPKIELKTAHARSILKKNVPLQKVVTQSSNLGAFVSALYTEDYELLSRSLSDVIIEPLRAMLIPEFDALKAAALETGALGSGISGSGPSVFALSKGKETAQAVAKAMEHIIKKQAVAYAIYVSPINTEGIKILDSQ